MFGAAIVAKTSRMVATKITSSKAYPCCPAFRRANPRLAVIMANLQPAPREAPWRCVRRKLLQIPHWRSQFSECGSKSEEHTSELQSQSNVVCRLLLEKKNEPIPVQCI